MSGIFTEFLCSKTRVAPVKKLTIPRLELLSALLLARLVNTTRSALEHEIWWGGVFERIIQSAKRWLRKAIGNARLTYDELMTSVTEVEMILNSRPLSYLSSEDIEEPLTPSHLLVGYRVLSLPDPMMSTTSGNLDHTATHRARRMKHLKKTVDDFWKRWRTEYLLGLREAHRHLQTPRGGMSNAAVGDIVIVHDEKSPHGLWKLGRINSFLEQTAM